MKAETISKQIHKVGYVGWIYKVEIGVHVAEVQTVTDEFVGVLIKHPDKTRKNTLVSIMMPHNAFIRME